MAELSDPFLDTLKSIADVTGGLQNIAVRKGIEALSLQHMNIFDLLIYPAVTDPTSLAAITTTALDSIVAKFFIQNISVGLPSLNYEVINETKHIRGITHPESITLTFIEDELGTVRTYLQNWLDDIITVNKDVDSEVGNSQWRFKDDQLASEKNAVLIPLLKSGLPSPVWIQIMGMKYKSINDMNHDQSNGDPMKIEATFKVNKVWFKPLIQI